MAEKQEAAKPQRPTITLPPKPSMDSILGPAHSPGPMTLVSSFFSDYCPESADFRSFSQLLAGAMNSPLALVASVPNQFTLDGSGVKSSREEKPGDGGEKNPGYKQNRPMGLAVVRSPMFTVPPGLSPSGLLYSPGFFSCQSPFGMSHQQALAQVTAQAAFNQSHMHMETDSQPSSTAPDSSTLKPSFISNESSQRLIPAAQSSVPTSSIPEPSNLTNPPQKYEALPAPVDKPAEDGYNWRKYGQKQVKGCEYPRSYYKCTYLNCPVKKKVERSLDGRITEIIYKGQHNHEIPQPGKRGKDGGGPGGGMNSQVKAETIFQNQSQVGNPNMPGVAEFAHTLVGRVQESVQATTADPSGSSDNEEADDAETITVGDEADDDEPNPKRRNVEAGQAEAASSHKTVTEPKIIVQTRSEVDLLDDGYRWRKYGQKVVKGNPHPRSYYKCTFVGCNVRKHVERAAADPKAVITAYEGKHNHTVPGARNSSHSTANSNISQPIPRKAVPENHSFLDQRPAVLRLKEERVAS